MERWYHNSKALPTTPNPWSQAMGSGRGMLAEDPSPNAGEEATRGGNSSSAPNTVDKPMTPMLAILTKQVSRHSLKWVEDWAQMLELCLQVTYTNDQLNSLYFTVTKAPQSSGQHHGMLSSHVYIHYSGHYSSSYTHGDDTRICSQAQWTPHHGSSHDT